MADKKAIAKEAIKSKARTGLPIIKPCTCIHEYQDSIYGKGNRLYNHAPAKGLKPRRYRCTVCGREQEF